MHRTSFTFVIFSSFFYEWDVETIKEGKEWRRKNSESGRFFYSAKKWRKHLRNLLQYMQEPLFICLLLKISVVVKEEGKVTTTSTVGRMNHEQAAKKFFCFFSSNKFVFFSQQ